jgi:hypothetical protein
MAKNPYSDSRREQHGQPKIVQIPIKVTKKK